MKTQVMLLLLAIVVTFVAVEGSLGPGIESKCKCIRTTSAFIHPRKYQHVDIFPQSTLCRRVEIIIRLINKRVVCINPETAWVKKVVSIITESKRIVPSEETST
ncbi:interleukin-8-like isoform X1 [Callorhinchus milii]|uniref:Interleukin-8 n=1 Tax=Callorhinchus milii TaxID=7868 RepID=K4FXW1_CALMI|nr:interleukin-8-like precursor [Callorhinchus milii]XP_042197225.1 interleukin-8-like isoform X1 [Callorhinchus milii]AFK10667.1 interleukin-8 [Callorhinchus milii]|eukprot:gi/632948578/ref/XP_007889672.1/ PREDICTED: interleukin-8-like [Callorhinchus milii]